ncbi:MAG: hypothetical protein P4L69_07130 [Desulfosporosinus sp.]|nr:hypothetical protein [Desulfosporosinus sp.]
MTEYVSRAGPVQAGYMPPGAGGVVGFEDFGGISGGADWTKAYNTSIMARFAPDTLAASVRRSFDDPYDMEITPAKPSAVSMVGADVFGPTSFHYTTRNNIVGDTRGEAAFGMISGEPPEGASEVSWASFSYPTEMTNPTATCGTCAPQFKKPNPVSQPPMTGQYGNPAAANSGRRSTVWSKVKSAYFM